MTTDIPFEPYVIAEWVCESGDLVTQSSEKIGNYPTTLNCDQLDARGSSLDLWKVKYSCPPGYLVEEQGSNVHLASSYEGNKDCER